MAQNLYKKYCLHSTLESSQSALRDIFSQEDDFLSEAQLALREYITVIFNIFFKSNITKLL